VNVLERSLRRIDAAQQRHAVTAFAFGVAKKFGDDNGGSLAVQLTYAMFVTVFPLLLLLVTVLSIVLADNPSDRHRLLSSALGEFPVVGQQLGHNVHALKRSSVFGLVVGVAGLVYGSSGLAQAALYAMSQVWNIPGAARPSYLTRMARSAVFLVVLAVGLVLSTALAGFGTFGQHQLWLGILGEALAVVVNVALCVAAFRVVTPKQVRTSSLLPGAVAGGIVWTVLQALGAYIVGHDLKGASALYGTFGLVLGLMAWIYLGAQVTLYAAELNTVLFHRLWPRGMVRPPLTAADQKSVALQAIENQRLPEQSVTTTFRGRPMTQDEYRDRGYEPVTSGDGLTLSSPEDADHEVPNR
jgi:YihY family inner membrane protein